MTEKHENNPLGFARSSGKFLLVEGVAPSVAAETKPPETDPDSGPPPEAEKASGSDEKHDG